MSSSTTSDLFARLAAPFEPAEVEWKPQSVKENRALAIAYVDARCVMDRLDAVLGIGNWCTSYRVLKDGVVCRLMTRIDGEWIAHEDVGGFSEQPDHGDRLKAGFSDSLKRTAIHLGVGRYLYSLPLQWCAYDPQRRRFVTTPQLPAWALPRPAKHAEPKPTLPHPALTNGNKEGPERISTEQAKRLAQAIRDHGVDYQGLFDEYKIGRLTELPACHFEDALRRCQARQPGAAEAQAEPVDEGAVI